MMIKLILVAQNISPSMSFMAILFFRNIKLNITPPYMATSHHVTLFLRHYIIKKNKI